MRGIRVRHGNIEVGNEYFLSSSFMERRFATWVVGEIQVSNKNIRPNARRDGFEQTPEFELFLEQSNALGRFLSRLCRKSSSQRCAAQTAARQLQEIEASMANVAFFIDKEHRDNFLELTNEKLKKAGLLIAASTDGQHLNGKCQNLRAKLESLRGPLFSLHNCIDGRTIRHADKIDILQKILKNLYREYGNCASVEDLMQRTLLPFLRSTLRGASHH